MKKKINHQTCSDCGPKSKISINGVLDKVRHPHHRHIDQIADGGAMRLLVVAVGHGRLGQRRHRRLTPVRLFAFASATVRRFGLGEGENDRFALRKEHGSRGEVDMTSWRGRLERADKPNTLLCRFIFFLRSNAAILNVVRVDHQWSTENFINPR